MKKMVMDTVFFEGRLSSGVHIIAYLRATRRQKVLAPKLQLAVHLSLMSDSRLSNFKAHLREGILKFWPYMVFLSFVVVYNILYLPRGVSLLYDEGYLQSLAARVLRGELPYRDFYFFRTPLSIYIQSAVIAVLGGDYKILYARIFCVIETTSIIMIASTLYYSLVEKSHLLLLLLISYVTCTLMLNFPWYSYDAVFFATIALVMFHRRRFFLSGLAVFLAGMCKQNFVGLMILLPLVSPVIRLVHKELTIIRLRETTKYFIGFLLPGVLYLTWLVASGRLGVFWENIVTLPKECSSVTLGFALFQNHGAAFIRAWPLVGSIILLFFASRSRWILYLAAAILGSYFLYWNAGNVSAFSYGIIFVNYSIIVIALIALSTKKGRGTPIEKNTVAIWRALIFALLIQYLSGMNYSGLVFSHIGAAIAFPLAILVFNRLQGSFTFKWPASLFVVILFLAGLFLKTSFVYRDLSLSKLTRQFSSPLLSGIYSSPEKVRAIESTLKIISEYSAEGDPIFVFPNFPSLYYLSGRINPTRVQWFYPAEYNNEILFQALSDVARTRPKVILIQENLSPPALLSFLNAEYQKIAIIGPLSIFVPS